MEKNETTPVDGLKQLLEMSLSAGRNWQSPQTGYIHYCYTQQDEDRHDPIPVFENVLFALALMRSRNADNINEAKDLLNRLFYFQNKEGDASHGNFPIYLHEYPTCKDRLLGAHLLSPLFWIYKNFHHVIGSELKTKLSSSMLSLVQYCLKTNREKAAPYPIAVKIAAGAKAIGSLLHNKEVEDEGEKLLESLHQSRDQTSWCAPATIADLLTAFQMIYPSIANSPEKDFWSHLIATWHHPSGAYVGPGWKETQRGNEPQTTAYDYFMGYYTGVFNYRSFFDHPIQLQATLVNLSEDRIAQPHYPVMQDGIIFDQACKVVQNQQWAYSLFGKGDNFNRAWEKTFFPIKLLWGTANRVRSFVSQGGNIKKVEFREEDNTIEMIFTYFDTFQVELRDKSQELSFYVDEQEGTKITVGGRTSTTFKLGEDVLLEDGNMNITVNFQIHEGDGQFLGHIMKGNRPSQVSLKGEHRFDAFDWQIFLRTIGRTEHCAIKATIRLSNSENKETE